MIRPLVLSLVSLILLGCSSTPNETKSISAKQLNINALLDLVASLPTPAEPESYHQNLFALPVEEKQRFLDYFYAEAQSDTPEFRRISHYLEDKMHQFSFRGDTFTAAEVIENSSGNCLSLAILTAAYAKEVGVKFKFDLVSNEPVYFRDENIDRISNHVRTKLFTRHISAMPKTNGRKLRGPKSKANTKVLFSEEGVVVDYFPVRNAYVGHWVSETYFVSMFYQNRAADLIAQEQHESALKLAKRGLLIAPNNHNLSNMVAVILAKQGQVETADQIYKQALLINPSNLELLTNYRILAKKLGQQETVHWLTRSINESNDKSPFRWLDLAKLEYANGRFKLAERYYLKAKAIAPYLPQVHEGIGKTLLSLGDYTGAKLAFEMALQNTHDDQLEALYSAKIHKLGRYQGAHKP